MRHVLAQAFFFFFFFFFFNLTAWVMTRPLDVSCPRSDAGQAQTTDRGPSPENQRLLCLIERQQNRGGQQREQQTGQHCYGLGANGTWVLVWVLAGPASVYKYL
jgi:hypothetical protein